MRRARARGREGGREGGRARWKHVSKCAAQGRVKLRTADGGRSSRCRPRALACPSSIAHARCMRDERHSRRVGGAASRRAEPCRTTPHRAAPRRTAPRRIALHRNCAAIALLRSIDAAGRCAHCAAARLRPSPSRRDVAGAPGDAPLAFFFSHKRQPSRKKEARWLMSPANLKMFILHAMKKREPCVRDRGLPEPRPAWKRPESNLLDVSHSSDLQVSPMTQSHNSRCLRCSRQRRAVRAVPPLAGDSRCLRCRSAAGSEEQSAPFPL